MRRAAVLRTAALLCLLTAGFHASAQSDSPLYRFEPDILIQHYPQWIIHDRIADTWNTGIDLTTFLRDAEFFIPQSPGYTAIGFFADPYVTRRIGTAARATVGLRLTGAAGLQGLYGWQPLVRLEYSPLPTVHIVMGTLYGTLTHGLYEPILGRERHIYAHDEQGVQLIAHIHPLRWRTDTWIHWENLLQPWQMDQERFTLASSNEITPIDLQHFQLSIPFAFLGSHRGGQFSALDTCIESLFTESAGLRMGVFAGNWKVHIHAPFFFYQDISPIPLQAYREGYGFWPQLTADFCKGQFHLLGGAGLWMGHHYIAPRGSYMFQCISWEDPDFCEPDRRMATARLALEHAYTDDFSIGADAEAYYDLPRRHFDIAFGLYMRYTPSWPIGR